MTYSSMYCNSFYFQKTAQTGRGSEAKALLLFLSSLYCMRFKLYSLIHNVFTLSSSSTHKFRLHKQTYTRTSKYPLPRIPSSKLHGNHSLTPIAMATGISITHAFSTDQFPLCLMCVSLYISLSASPAPSFSKVLIFHSYVFLLQQLIFHRGNRPDHNNLLTQPLSHRGPVRFSGEPVAVVRPVVHLQSLLPQAKCP